MNVAILHYAAPPTVGGVEQTIYYHARELTRAGHHVRILAGAGAPFDPRVEVVIAPEFSSRHPDVLAVKAQLDRGEVTSDFVALRERLKALLARLLSNVDALIAHNLFTLHKNLPLTAALYDLLPPSPPLSGAGERSFPAVLAWHHDLAWDSARYRKDLHEGYPWDLLRRPWPGVRHVTVSAAQQARLAALYDLPPEHIAVVPPGVAPARFFRWTEMTRRLVSELRLWDADLLLLLPARITRRKNVEMALRILAALRTRPSSPQPPSPATAGERRDISPLPQRGRAAGGEGLFDARLVVTGPPGPHNPANVAYLQSLLDLRRELGLEGAAHFLYELGITPDDDTLADLYHLTDALLFPSAQEGFGIPVLEAGLARLPVFCSDIPPLRETGGNEVYAFALDADPADVAGLIRRILEANPAHILRRRVLAHYTWEAIVRHRVIPLLERR